MADPFVSGVDLDAFVSAVLREDLGERGDLTSAATIPEGMRLDAVMATREAIVVAGLPLAAMFFRALDPRVEIETADEPVH